MVTENKFVKGVFLLNYVNNMNVSTGKCTYEKKQLVKAIANIFKYFFNNGSLFPTWSYVYMYIYIYTYIYKYTYMYYIYNTCS